MYPPHLPFKTCSTALHHVWRQTYVVVILVVLSLSAGITGSLVTTAWIEPTLYTDSNLYFLNRGNNTVDSRQQPDIALLQRYQYTTVRIVDGKQVVNTDFYPESSLIGRMIMLSSNGWGALYTDSFVSSNVSSWLAIDYQGVIHTIEKTVYDKDRSVLYIKLAGNEFRVASFPDWNSMDRGSGVWVARGSNWRRHTISDYQVVAEPLYEARLPYALLSLNPVGTSGLAFNDQGQLVGFADETGLVHMVYKVEQDLPSLLEKGERKSLSIDWRGYFVEQISSGTDIAEQYSGFYVLQTASRNVDKVINGDVIVSINGSSVSAFTFDRMLAQAPSPFTVTVWRKGERFDILMEK
ncbi:MAG: hypothetical protein WCW16_04440 [Candidatus Magasanikbacteria bacterium]